MTKTLSPMFTIVKQMNIAFGNPEGNPANIVREVHTHASQCKNIGAEFIELMNAFGFTVDMNIQPIPNTAPGLDIDGVRDALCDIMVFALGAYHRMGLDADEDMQAVIDGVMTRFCKDETDLANTELVFKVKGVKYTVHGEFPFKYLRSAEDQFMPEYPKGKFLKSVSYHQPVFKPVQMQVFLSDFELMAHARAMRMEEERKWLEWRTAVRQQMERDLDAVAEHDRPRFFNGELTIVGSVREVPR